MSTVYGTVKTRDGREIDIEAFGMSHSVGIMILDNEPQSLKFNARSEVDRLIALLEVARNHVWTDE